MGSVFYRIRNDCSTRIGKDGNGTALHGWSCVATQGRLEGGVICTCGGIHWTYGCEAYQEAHRAVWRERRAGLDARQGFRHVNRENSLGTYGRAAQGERSGFVTGTVGDFVEQFR